MSVNIVQNGELLPIAGKTVPMPTPDYVDEQYNNSITYSKGDTCISGNVRYRYKNSTASSGHQPPNTTYWEEYSIADDLKKRNMVKFGEVNIKKAAGSYTSITNNDINLSDYNLLVLQILMGDDNAAQRSACEIFPIPYFVTWNANNVGGSWHALTGFFNSTGYSVRNATANETEHIGIFSAGALVPVGSSYANHRITLYQDAAMSSYWISLRMIAWVM